MKSNKIRSYLLIITYFVLFYNSGIIKDTHANPLVPYTPSCGGVLIKDNNTYSMPNANVLIEIDATNPSSHYDLHFIGNYTIFNPNNSTNVTIVAPFSPDMFGITYDTINDILYENGSYIGPVQIEMPEVISNCIVKSNDSTIPYEIFVFEPRLEYQWRTFHMIGLLGNITLPKNNTSLLEYSFNSHITIPRDYGYSGLEFMYFVGTSRTWFGNITETVEFRVKGYQPDKAYSWRMDPDYIRGRNCTIFNIKDGKSYLWVWNNERIYEDYTILYYYNQFGNFANGSIPFGYYFLIFTLLGIAVVITVQKGKMNYY
ncbi:MAG: hypothetical protein ACFFA3_19245 [Promethearchaeota archaeon]